MEGGRRSAPQKRLASNQRVSGAVGNFIEGPSKRRRRERWFGHVLRAVGEKKYLIRFDNGEEKEFPSAVLKVEHMIASLPPDVPLPHPVNAQEEAILENAVDEVADTEETEDMPVDTPESEEMEEQEAEAAEMEEVGVTEEPDTNGRMPGQLPSAGAVQPSKDYHQLKAAAKEKIAALVGHEVTVGTRKNGSMKWKVISSYDPPEENVPNDAHLNCGLIDFDTLEHKRSEVLVEMFLTLSFLDWKEKVQKMNEAVEKAACRCKKFSNEEFLTGLAMLIGAAEFSQKGIELFTNKDQSVDEDPDNYQWRSISQSPKFEQYMAFSRFKDFRRFLPAIHADESRKDTDPWYQFSGAIDEFNFIRNTRVECGTWVCADESMSAWRPRTTALGGLPNISFVVRKPEPLGKI